MKQNSVSNPLHETHFKELILSLAKKFEPLQIICFNRRFSSSEVNGCFVNTTSDRSGHYALLMVTEGAMRIDHEVQDYTNTHYRQGTVTILCHSKDAVTESIKANSRFFMGVYTTGQLLYSHNGLQEFDFNTSFIPLQAAEKAQKHFDRRLPLADGFLQGAAGCLAKCQYKVCVFMLHQAMEQCCIALIRVHIAYRLEMHNLHRLLRLSLWFSEIPYKMFVTGRNDDERLFDVLIKSYSQARYKDDFSVDGQDAEELYDRVSAFLTATREMCKSKIVALNEEADLYKQS
ncbi:HEPN domain-containing protein [Pedobacter ginsengisoli]|uniref:HEPN domain-containing protein n=1 Tax=Pedobacter ginsengisoli TaxID=363852 RepID=UPI00254E25D1|nr:HEPN domain-containing protein [Pedobacter ginsengisoli]